MKQVLKYEAQRDHARHLQNQLQYLLQQVQQEQQQQHGTQTNDSYYHERIQDIVTQPWSLTFHRNYGQKENCPGSPKQPPSHWYKDLLLPADGGGSSSSSSSRNCKLMDAILTKEAKRRLFDQATALTMNREGPMAA